MGQVQWLVAESRLKWSAIHHSQPSKGSSGVQPYLLTYVLQTPVPDACKVNGGRRSLMIQ